MILKTIVKKSLGFTIIFCLSILLINCRKESIREYKEINALIVNSPYLPNPPAAHAPILMGTNSITITENDISYVCEEKTYTFANNMEDIIAFNPNSGTLYPGALVQGKYVRNGELVSIGSFDRNPLTVTLDDYGISNEVEEPSNASVSNAVIDMVGQNSIPTIARIYFNKTEAYSTDQGLLSLGIDYAWVGGNISPSMSISSSASRHSVYLYFLQSYYTASVNAPANPADFFGADVTSEDISNNISSDNPLCYVSSVTYGRMLLAKITSTSTEEELKAAIQGSLGAVDGILEYTGSTILENSEYEISILGGNSTDAVQAATQGMSGIINYLNNGANFSVNSLGTPISYVVKYASDNSTVKLGKSVEYTVRENCIFDPQNVQNFSFIIDGFDIVADCDQGVLTNTGGGEFSYAMQIKDNDEVLRTINSSSIAEVWDGETLTVAAGPYTHAISTLNNHKITIEGCLYEWDDNGANVNQLCWPDIEFLFPWNEIPNNYITFTQVIDAGNSCNAVLKYRIKKIN
jgi:hypothetical protein